MYASQSILVSGVRYGFVRAPTRNLEDNGYPESELEKRKQTGHKPVVSPVVQYRLGDSDRIAEHVADGEIHILGRLLDDDLLGALYRRPLLW